MAMLHSEVWALSLIFMGGVFYCRWAVENFRSANAFVVEPPQFNAALVGMTMSAGVSVGRAVPAEGGEAGGASATGATEAVAGMSHDTSMASADGENNISADAWRVTFS
jgi:hypothetical protein